MVRPHNPLRPVRSVPGRLVRPVGVALRRLAERARQRWRRHPSGCVGDRASTQVVAPAFDDGRCLDSATARGPTGT